MKRLAVLFPLLLLLLPTTAAHADGCIPPTCGTTSTAEPGSGLLLVRPSGQDGSLFGYDLRTQSRRFALSNGRLTADGRTFFSASVDRSGTTVTRYDARTGARLGARAYDGSWYLAAVSGTGRTVALSAMSNRGRRTTFALADGRLRGGLSTTTLRGSYGVDAISPDGRRVFLIHWMRAGYELQQYDVATRRLQATRLADPEDKMQGASQTAVATRDGHWLLTLYITSDGMMSFVHALDLRRGVAHCIDLPWSGDYQTLASTQLVLSPSERALYLVSPVLGRISVVDMRTLRLRRSVEFAPVRTITAGPSAAVSANGRMLAFNVDRNVWLYDTAYGIVRGPFHGTGGGSLGIVAGLGFAPDGKRLLALRTDGQYDGYVAATGRSVAVRRVPSERFAIRSGTTGPLVGYGSAALQPLFFLPPGRASADGTAYFGAKHKWNAPYGSTTISRYAPRTGTRLHSFDLKGVWQVGAVSASGATFAIARQMIRTTQVQVWSSSGRTLHRRTLQGMYSLDAVTDDGNKLFLIQHYRKGHYAVRALDFVRNRLWTATLREKGVAEEPVMTGRAAGQVASRNGEWLLTLYLNTKEHKAFVHALNLGQAYAVCIDLPLRRHKLATLRDYSLAMTPDGRVYAANPALGVLARVDLRKQSVIRTRSFAPGSEFGWSASAVSRDGRMLYFAGGDRLWSYDTFAGFLRPPHSAGGPVVGLAFSRDGQKLFAVRTDGGVSAFDATEGTALTA